MLGVIFTILVSYILYKENVITKLLEKCIMKED